MSTVYTSALKISKLDRGTKILVHTLSGDYIIHVLDPKSALVTLQGNGYKTPTERTFGGSFGPGEILWRQGYARRGMALRMKNHQSKYKELEYPTAAMTSWEVLPKEPYRFRPPPIPKPTPPKPVK